eukprot:269784-Chlamydomonas_euryale.AAC.6
MGMLITLRTYYRPASSQCPPSSTAFVLACPSFIKTPPNFLEGVPLTPPSWRACPALLGSSTCPLFFLCLHVPALAPQGRVEGVRPAASAVPVASTPPHRARAVGQPQVCRRARVLCGWIDTQENEDRVARPPVPPPYPRRTAGPAPSPSPQARQQRQLQLCASARSARARARRAGR